MSSGATPGRSALSESVPSLAVRERKPRPRLSSSATQPAADAESAVASPSALESPVEHTRARRQEAVRPHGALDVALKARHGRQRAWRPPRLVGEMALAADGGVYAKELVEDVGDAKVGI